MRRCTPPRIFEEEHRSQHINFIRSSPHSSLFPVLSACCFSVLYLYGLVLTSNKALTPRKKTICSIAQRVWSYANKDVRSLLLTRETVDCCLGVKEYEKARLLSMATAKDKDPNNYLISPVCRLTGSSPLFVIRTHILKNAAVRLWRISQQFHILRTLFRTKEHKTIGELFNQHTRNYRRRCMNNVEYCCNGLCLSCRQNKIVGDESSCCSHWHP